MRFVFIIPLLFYWSGLAFGLTVQEHASDSSNPHGAKMKITQKLNVGTDDDYLSGYALVVEGGATIDTLNLGGGNLTFGTASSLSGSLSIGTTTAGTSRIRVIGTITATTFVGDGTLLTGVGAGTGSGNWTDSGSSTQTLYPDTITRKVAVGSTTTNGNQFAVAGDARIYGTLTATKFVGDGSLLTGITGGGTETIWVNTGSTTAQGTVTQNIVLGSTTAAANQKFTVVGSSTVRDLYVGGSLSIGTGGSSLIGGTPTINVAIGDNDTGFRYLSDGKYALTANNDDQIIIDGDTDRVYIGTTSGTVKLTVKDDITATGTITATIFAGDGSLLTGISDAKWTDTGEALRPGTITYNLRLGTTTADGATLQVEGSATVSGTITANMIVGNCPDGSGSTSLINGGQLVDVKAEMLSEWVDHVVATTEVHGVGSETIASRTYVDNSITAHDGSVTAHYGTSSAIANTPILRDSNGRAQIATGTSALDIANVGQVPDIRQITKDIAPGESAKVFVTNADVGATRKVYPISFFARINGSDNWTSSGAGSMTAMLIRDLAGNSVFDIPIANLLGNTNLVMDVPSFIYSATFMKGLGATTGYGIEMLTNGTADTGSRLYVTLTLLIK